MDGQREPVCTTVSYGTLDRQRGVVEWGSGRESEERGGQGSSCFDGVWDDEAGLLLLLTLSSQ